MKTLSLKISDKDYSIINKKFEPLGLSWKLILKQFTGFLKSTGALDTEGLPIHEFSTSLFKKTQGRLEGPIESALTNYLKYKLSKNDNKKKLIFKALKKDLTEVLKLNKNQRFRRSYVFEEKEMNCILKEMWLGAIRLAENDLNIPPIKVKRPSYQELFECNIANSKSKPLLKHKGNKK